MRTIWIISLLLAVCLAAASFRDPRKLHAVAPPTQDEVARQQSLQKQQAQVGGVPERTDDGGYAPQVASDPDAAAILAKHDEDAAEAPTSVISQNAGELKSESEKPKRTAFGAFWALLAGLLLAFGLWSGLQKYGPKPPGRLR